jgi:hypothetical protein
MDKIAREIRKTHYAFKKNKKISSIEKNIVSFAKGLSSEQLALLVLKLISGLAMPMHRKKLHQLLKENIESNEFDNDINEFIELILQQVKKDLDTTCSLKVKDLLANS